MLNREHLIIGALGFVLGGIVATASISTVLMTQSQPAVVCPPTTQPTQTTESSKPETQTPTATTDISTPTVAPQQVKGLAGEELDRLSEDQQQLAERKKSLDSQLQDSNEIIRLKEQQIKELEAQLKQP
ncbi:hypothetical protein [Agitococcus lubricus]|uniref:Uncharacterized protein n=1 Tax=Agitococcus lubricus TaxID=1077255 RepID=A0A2T5J2F3_9GAMM|nr:hypothetical protein [Agitococcus lubricus]PTQ90700.1 hypothetical protein C8N29_102100 [Agitococcus lubricus]